MPFDYLGRRRPDGGPDRRRRDAREERTPEEEALAQKAREEAARRAELRRSEADDVADLLGGMLEASIPDPEGAAAPDARDLARPADGWGAIPQDAARAAPGGIFASPSPEERVPADRPAPRGTPVEELPGWDRLSPAMRAVGEDLLALGTEGEAGQLAFETAWEAAPFERMAELRDGRSRRRRPALDFEPDEGAAGGPESAKDTVIISADAAEQPREYTLGDLSDAELPPTWRGEESSYATEEGGILEEEDLTTAGLFAGGRASRAEREYGLDDLPPAPGETVFDLGEAPPVGEAMPEVDLDDHGLDAALAAADAAFAEGREAPPEPEAAATAARSEDAYDISDLPPVPRPLSAGRGPAEESPTTAAESAAGGAAMSEAELPPAPPAPPAPAPAGAVPEARRAADLSAEQLAAVEQMIEREVDAEEKAAAAPEPVPVGDPWPVAARKQLVAAWLGAVRAAKDWRRSADRALDPYALSCKRLLGIAGIIMLCAVGTLSVKIWVLNIY